MDWSRHLRNPTQQLGAGRPPAQSTVDSPSRDLMGWRVQGKKAPSTVVAAFAYTSPQSAARNQEQTQAFVDTFLAPFYGPLFINRVKQTLIVTTTRDIPKSEEFVEATGSPYFSTKVQQTRASDEPETITWTDLLTGKAEKKNPPVQLTVLTVPHAFSDGVDDGHDTDWCALETAAILGASIPNTILLPGTTDRDDLDLNRRESMKHPYHEGLDKLLIHAGLLLDIHSYPPNYPVWGEYDVVLFSNGPFQTKDDRESVMSMAEHMTAQGFSVLVDVADEKRHFIQNKGLVNGVEAHLIEVNESADIDSVAQALASWSLGAISNPPTELPEGVNYQALTLNLPLSDNPNAPVPVSLPEQFELELELLGFSATKRTMLPNSDVLNFVSLRLPSGFDPRPTLTIQRGRQTTTLYKAQFLNSDEVSAILSLVQEAAMSQPIPIKANPPEKTVREKLAAKGFEGEELEQAIRLLTGLPNKGKTSRVIKIADDLGVSISEDEVRQLYIDERKQKKQDEGGEKSANQFSNNDLIEMLKKQGKEVPMKENGKPDRDKMIRMLGLKQKSSPTEKKVKEERKKDSMRLSTRVTKMVISNLFPGSHKISEFKEQKEGSQVDANKVRGLSEFKSLSKKQKQELFPENKAPNWGKIKERFGDLDIYKSNPPVSVEPKKQRFSMDITGEFVKGASVVVEDGMTASLDVGELADPPSSFDSSFGKIVRVNMFRKRAGFTVEGADEQPEYIISVETGNQHFYARSKVEIPGFSQLKHFPDKASEPRLRVETRGYLELKEPVSTVNVRGVKHPLYETITVQHTYESNPPKTDLSRYKRNPSAYAEAYVADHQLMGPKEESQKFTKVALKGPVGSDEFFEQVAHKTQAFGEGQGWVRDGFLYWRKGPGHLNYVEVDGHMLEGGTAWMHTHPAAWEPSQSSPDDFKVMHGLFINHGVQDFFTIIADRIDWFHVMKKDRIPLDEMVEIIEDFEADIEREFEVAEAAFQRKMGDTPYLTHEQTRYITEHFNRTIPEFNMKYRAYLLSPAQMVGRTMQNPLRN
jgi:hypothetical protein